MKKETVQAIRKLAEDLGFDVIHFQGDNSNFFAEGEGIKANTIIFDDANERCYAIRLNNDSASVRGPYRLTIFDYDQLQYGSIEMYQEDLPKVIEKLCAEAGDGDPEEIKKKFARRKHDRRGKKVDYNPEVEVKKDDMGTIGTPY